MLGNFFKAFRELHQLAVGESQPLRESMDYVVWLCVRIIIIFDSALLI
jgi:hypothetical protein